MFGLNLMYLAWGYITAVNFLSFSNYIPSDFFTPIQNIFKGLKMQKNTDDARRSITYIDQKSGAEINGLSCVHVIHSDGTESKYFIKGQEFTFILNILRKYFRLVVPVSIGIFSILYILPFVSDGPVYLAALKTQFLIACEGSWFIGFGLFQNLYYWPDNNQYDKGTCLPYVTKEGVLNDDTGDFQTTSIDVSACKDSCGLYLTVFANCFQFYLITLVIMWIHKHARRISYVLILLISIACTGLIFFFVLYHQIKAYLFYDENYMRYLMHRPWFRLPSYLIGTFIGLIISRVHSARLNLETPFLLQLLIQLSGAAICFCSVFALYYDFENFPYKDFNMRLGFNQPESFNRLIAAAYTSMAPLAFNLGFIMILLPSLLYMKKDAEGNILANKNQTKANLRSLIHFDGWRVLYKLSNCAYVAHYLVVFWFFASINSDGLILCQWLIMRV